MAASALQKLRTPARNIGISSEFTRARRSLQLAAGRTMLRLKPRQRVVFGEKLLDLPNFAATALVFSQFVGQQPLSWAVIGAGAATWIVLASLALWLMGAR